jgi:hypothetical protein
LRPDSEPPAGSELTDRLWYFDITRGYCAFTRWKAPNGEEWQRLDGVHETEAEVRERHPQHRKAAA